MPQRPTATQLRDMVRSIAYEYVAMNIAYERFEETCQKSVPLFESFLIHARNLYVRCEDSRDLYSQIARRSQPTVAA